jgi:large subunit ribosomal protein L23
VNSKYYSTIISPSITEKNTILREENKYVFKVDRNSNKTQIKKAIENVFNVKVESINTMIVKGKKKRMGRFTGNRPNWKKAIVKLAEGQTIDKLGEV